MKSPLVAYAMERELNRRREIDKIQMEEFNRQHAKDTKRIKELENKVKILEEQQRKNIQNSEN